jgi:Dolichyl-phosphate-mannose-protein mannosyltransferase
MTAAPATLSRPTVLARLAASPAAVGLVAVVSVSFAWRAVAASWHNVPRLFPDEYIYAALARNIGHGSLTIRGEPASFPALVEPLLQAPLWRIAGDDLQLGYSLVQTMHALTISLVAIPVYVIARRAGMPGWWALTSGLLALALPAMVFASFVTADATGLLLAMIALAVGIEALARPTPRAQVAFLLLAGLATMARVQYVVLPIAFLAAGVAVNRGSIRRTLREYRLFLLLAVAPLLLVVVSGPRRILGYYQGVVDLHVSPGAMAHWVVQDGMFLAFAAGIVLVPGAVVGVAQEIARPMSRRRLAVAALAASFVTLLLVEAVVYASNGADRFQERYLLAVLPLAPIAFGLAATRLRHRVTRVALASVAGGLFLVAALVPLSADTVAYQKQDSPTLQAIYQLGSGIGIGNASLVVALAASALAALAAIGAWRPRLAQPLAALGAGVAVGAAAIGGAVYDVHTTRATERTFVVAAAGPSWVDRAGLDDVVVMMTPFANRQQVSQQLFWNTSLTEILRMEDTSDVDAYGSRRARVAPRGTIHADGELVHGPLLVEEYASWAKLEDARLVRRTVNAALWEPEGTPRLAFLLAGRYFDGMLSATSSFTVWAGADGRRSGTIALPLSLPDDLPAAEIAVHGPGVDRVVTVRPGRTTTLRIPFDTTGAFRVELRAVRPFRAAGGRLVAALAGIPHLIEGAPQTGEVPVKD